MAAVAAAITGCSTTTTNLFFKGCTAPFLRSCRRRSNITGLNLINNHRSSVPSAGGGKLTPLLLPPRSPLCLVPNSRNNTARRLQLLLCYCTESSNTAAVTTTKSESESESEEKGIKEAANSLDIRVGRIVKAWRHEEADSLYVEEVDIGEAEPRTICSGLVKYTPLHLLQDRNVIVLANLKARNMRGVKSFGMLMAASDAAHENVELLVPPEGAVPGERVWFGSVDEKDNLPDAASPNQIQKKKIWELVQPHLRTDEAGVATLDMIHQMRTSAGPVISQSLYNANIS
ncbi:hypothetical protein ACP275_07G116400 [Erythranthe tilingii]